MARSLTGPEARVSINTRANTAGEAAMAALKSARDQLNRPGAVNLMLVMSGSDRDKLLAFCHKTLGSLEDYDHRQNADLIKTLEALDTELLSMENWLQDRAAAIKPLTDDCADIEEENRQLEQQWKSYDMLGAEMRRLLQGLEINEFTEKSLNNPASALVYSPDGSVNVDECHEGIEKIYEAGKALLDAIEYVSIFDTVSFYRQLLFGSIQTFCIPRLTITNSFRCFFVRSRNAREVCI